MEGKYTAQSSRDLHNMELIDLTIFDENQSVIVRNKRRAVDDAENESTAKRNPPRMAFIDLTIDINQNIPPPINRVTKKRTATVVSATSAQVSLNIN